MSAQSDAWMQKYRESRVGDAGAFMDDVGGRYDTLDQEMADPANLPHMASLMRERSRLGPRGAPNPAVGGGIPIDSPEAQSSAQRKGPLSEVTDAEASTAFDPGNEPVGALSSVAQRMPNRQEPDIAAMLAKFVPQDDSSSKYLAMAAALGRPTGFGSFGETMTNVSDAMLEQKRNQEKLRAQYTPLIMTQVAAQQARDEQAQYRAEAQQQAIQAQKQAAALLQQGRADLATQAQTATAEQRERDRLSREGIAAQHAETLKETKRIADKAPAGYMWGPVGADGNPTQIAVKGGPADLKQVGVLNADTTALSGTTASFDRLASAANQVLQHPGLPGITGIAGALPNMWGGKAADAEALLGTLKSQIGFGVLQDLRNNSKTGGALGSVSDAEGKRLEANLAALDKSQSLEQFQTNLKAIVDYAEKAKDRMREAYNLKHGDGVKSGTPAPGMPPADALAAERARRAKLKGQ